MSSFSASEMQQIFKRLDQNGDNHVSINELQSLFDNLKVGPSVDELEHLVGKNKLNFAEFVYFCNTVGNQEEEDKSESDMVKGFEVFDKNHDGFISSEELRNALSVMGLIDERGDLMDVERMIKAYDMNCDGLLDYNEFKKMMS